MKESPYTVPEGFFEQAGRRAEKAADGIRTRRRAIAGIACGLAIFFAIGAFTGRETAQLEDPFDTTGCDIFLENFNI